DYLELLEAGVDKGGQGDIVLDEQGNIVEAAKPFWEDPKSLGPVLEIVDKNPKPFRGAVTRDFRTGSILIRTQLTGSREIEQTLARVREQAEKTFPRKLRVRITGNLVLLTGTASDIVAGQIKSLSIALVVIFAVMSFMFLSAKVGFLAILPNALSIGIFFGVMGWFGILLNLGTSLIAAIALGIAVDSTIHFMSRLNTELKGATDQVSALVRTLRAVGAPILYATAALFFGFLTFAFSSFVPIQHFGILAGVTMVTALVANLVMLPALLATTKIITVWDLLAVKLGRDPGRTIPLFAGLRPAQARIVVLMGEIKRYAPGDTIVRRGELGNEMYVILQGTVDVFAGAGAERRRIAEQRRGEVFGEMGLVRHIERSADVVAADAVEVLAVDERFLQRVQMRYPRIASKVFLNLTRILSDRLQRMTDQFVAARA
ncbi:MAG: MMPL family transporter, partial [Candidatus Binatia bacterium]